MVEVLLYFIYLLLFGLIAEAICVLALIIVIIILSKELKIKNTSVNLAVGCVFINSIGKPLCGFSFSYFYYTQNI